MDSILFLSILVGLTVLILLNVLLELRLFGSIVRFFVELFQALLDNLGKYNYKRKVEREFRNMVVTQKETFFVKYNRFIQNMLDLYDKKNLFSLESVTSILAIIFSIVVIMMTIFLKNITVSFMISVSILIILFTILARQSRLTNAIISEAIADAEDAICPLARDGVLVAIKKVMETDYIHRKIRIYFSEFIDNCETGGYSFRQAMLLLNKRLGSRFDNFAKKAIIFEYNERKGMADVFLDIVDENAVLREINAKKEVMFAKMNRDFVMNVFIIVLFFLYAMTGEDFRNFIWGTTAGKLINAICIDVICITFAVGQSLQSSLELKRKRMEK